MATGGEDYSSDNLVELFQGLNLRENAGRQQHEKEDEQNPTADESVSGTTTAKIMSQMVPLFDKLLQNHIFQRQTKASVRSRGIFFSRTTEQILMALSRDEELMVSYNEEDAVWKPPEQFKLLVMNVEEEFTIKAMIECEEAGEIEEHTIEEKSWLLEPHLMQYIIEKEREELRKITQKHKFHIIKSAEVSCLKVKARNQNMETAKLNLRGLIQDLSSKQNCLLCSPLDVQTKLTDLFWKEIKKCQTEGRIKQDVDIFKRSKTYFYVGKQSELQDTSKTLTEILHKLKRHKDSKETFVRGKDSQGQTSTSFVLSARQSKLFDKTRSIFMAEEKFKCLSISKENDCLFVSGSKEDVTEFGVWIFTFINSFHHDMKNVQEEMFCLLNNVDVVNYIDVALETAMIHAYWEICQDGRDHVVQVTAFTRDTVQKAMDVIFSCVSFLEIPKKLLRHNRFTALLNKHESKVISSESKESQMETLYYTKDVEKSLKKMIDEIKVSESLLKGSEAAELNIHESVLLLIKHGTVKEFVNQVLKRKHITASWDVVFTENSSKIISKASNKSEATECCKEVASCFTYSSCKRSLCDHEDVRKLVKRNEGHILVIGQKDESVDTCVVVYSCDIKSNVQKVFQDVEKQEKLKMAGMDDMQEEIEIKLTLGLYKFLIKNCREELNRIEKDEKVTIKRYEVNHSIMINGLYDKVMSARRQIFQIAQNIQMTSEVVRTKKSLDSKEIADFVRNKEEEEMCLVTFEEEKEDRLKYQYSWIVSDKSAHAVFIILAKGDAETAHCDALICPVKHDWMPMNKIGTTIFQKGDAEFIRSGARQFLDSTAGAKMRKKSIEGDVITIHSQGHLDAEFIMLSVIPSWQRVEYVTNHTIEFFVSQFVAEAVEKKMRKVVVPIEFVDSKINAVFCTLIVKFLDKYRRDLQCPLECILVLSDRDYSYKVQAALDDHFRDLDPKKVSRVNFHCGTPELTHPKNRNILQSPIEVSIRKDSMISVSNQVDMIVNSTNCELDLTVGFISTEILKHGGNQLNFELKERHPNGILYGEIAITRGGQLKCSFICHGVCFPLWIEDGKYSLKVMHTFVWNCLVEAENRKCKSVALPALGTGRLEYPMLQVAKQMISTVKEYGNHHPSTIIEKVVFVVHNENAFEVFLNVRRSTEMRNTMKPLTGMPEKLHYLEAVDQGKLRVQILSHTTAMHSPEEIEARIKCSRSKSGLNKTIFPDLHWDESSCCYVGNFEIGKLDKTSREGAVDYILNQCEENRLLTIAMYLEDDVLDYKELSEWFQKYEYSGASLPVGTNTVSASVHKKKKKRYLNLMQIILHADAFKHCQGLHKNPGYVQKFKNLWESFKFMPIEKSLTSVIKCQVFAQTQKTTHDVLKKLIVLLTSEACDVTHVAGNWAVETDGKCLLLPDYCQKALHNAVGLRQQFIEVMDYTTGLTYKYDIDNMERRVTSATSYKTEKLCIIDETRRDEDSSFEIITLAELEDKSLEMEEGSLKETFLKKKSSAEDPVFQSVKADLKVRGNINMQVLGDLLHDAGIKVKVSYDASERAVSVEGELSEIQKAEKLLHENQVGSKIPPREEKRHLNGDLGVPLENTDYQTFEFFAMKEEWFSSKRNMIKEKDSAIVLSHGMQSGVKEQIERLLKKIHGMQREEIEVTKDEYSKAEAAVESLKQKEDMKDVYFGIRQNCIIIVSESFDEMSKAKHKVHLALGRIQETKKGRKERQFGTGPIDSQETAQTEQPAAGKPRGKRDFSNLDVEKTDAGSSTSSSYGASSGKGSFLTKEGIVVKVYCDSITKLNVDCIVNAANESLSHGAGVAYAISRAAGRELDQEGSAYVQTYGKIEVGKCCVTKAGNLNYDCVIHTVGPRWNDYNDKRQCLRLLREAVLVTFGEASKRKLRSIAVPAISSGIFAVPRMRCVEQYFKAVEEYCKTSGRTSSLKEIHFVDKDEEMVKLIQEQFSTYNWDFSSPGNSSHANNAQERGNLSGSLRSSAKSVELKYSEKTAESSPIITTDEKAQLGVSDYDEYHYKNLKVFLYKADICTTKVDMVVCPQDPEFRERGRIAQAICRSYVELHSEDDWRKLKGTKGTYGNVKSLKVKSEACHWNYVAHAVPPRYFKDKSKNYYYTDHLKATVKNIFREMKIEGCKSVGIPVLGAAELGAETPLPIVADCFSTEIQRFGDHLFSANTYNIHIIYYNDDQHKAFDDEFSRKFQKVQKPLAPPEDVEMRDIMDEQVQEHSENCSICMDTPTKPKTLGCGHTFCTDCINQYLEGYKAACPNCGMIFGRLTGDQPDGKISISRKSYLHLPGYDTYGTIVVTYSFPDGEQGADHPNPGKPYKGVSRSGNLPDNTEGKLVAKLLNVAFSRRLIFTIGRSRTSGQDGVLTWNDIHHKTRTHGGPDRFGYPDETYLERVLDELSVKGVTKESADNPEEYAEYTRVFGKW